MAAVQSGEALMKLGDLNAATSTFQEALSYSPKNGLAFQRLAESQTASGDMKGAAETYQTLLGSWPGKDWSSSQNWDPAVHMHFAIVLLNLGQRDKALTIYRRGYQLLQTREASIATTPSRGPLPVMLIASEFTPVQIEAAAATATAIHTYNWSSQDEDADFQRAIALQPDLPVPYFYLGQIYKNKSGRAADALTAFRRAEQLGGPEMKPLVDKAGTEGPLDFKEAFKKAQANATL